MQVQAKIEVPTDLNEPPIIKNVFYEIDLEFVVDNPCLTSVLDTFTVDNMASTVLGPTLL